ncbi:BrnT family toxin [Bartonella sp. DGB2]|uniref:BrnT family toxin n=1 Tax=Bartonella sp. DGB2 TaxID=3388426 RepID=UPI0039903820
MKIIWDEPKRLSNLDKHGLDFSDVIYFDWKNAFISDTYSNRLKAIGRFANGTMVVVFALLGTEAISVISFRPANEKERKVFNDHYKKL